MSIQKIPEVCQYVHVPMVQGHGDSNLRASRTYRSCLPYGPQTNDKVSSSWCEHVCFVMVPQDGPVPVLSYKGLQLHFCFKHYSD